MQNTKQELKKEKYKYIFLITIIIIGIISGIILSNVLSYNDKKEISIKIRDYLLNLKEGNNLNYLANFFNSLKIDYFYYLLIIIFNF